MPDPNWLFAAGSDPVLYKKKFKKVDKSNIIAGFALLVFLNVKVVMNMKKNKLISFFYFLFLGRIWIRVSKILYPDRIILFRICNSSFTPESALILTKQRTLNLLGTTWFYRTAKPSFKSINFNKQNSQLCCWRKYRYQRVI